MRISRLELMGSAGWPVLGCGGLREHWLYRLSLMARLVYWDKLVLLNSFWKALWTIRTPRSSRSNVNLSYADGRGASEPCCLAVY